METDVQGVFVFDVPGEDNITSVVFRFANPNPELGEVEYLGAVVGCVEYVVGAVLHVVGTVDGRVVGAVV